MATTEIYTLSLHDALPICTEILYSLGLDDQVVAVTHECDFPPETASKPKITDRKSTRLNSSHRTISYAVFCLKKKRRRWRTSCPSTAERGPRAARREARHL